MRKDTILGVYLIIMGSFCMFFPINANAGEEGGYIAPGLQSSSGSAAVAYGSNIRFGGAPGRQKIETVGALGSFFANNTAPCIIQPTAQAGFMSGAAGASVPIQDLPCHFDQMAKTLGAMGVAAQNVGMKQLAQETVEDGIDILAGTDINLYLLRKAKGRTPPIRPDIGVFDALPGGMVHQHIIQTPGWSPPIQSQPSPHVSYEPPPSPNPYLDNGFKNQMQK